MLPGKFVKSAIVCLLVAVFTACTDHDLEKGSCVQFDIAGTYAYPIPFQSDAWFALQTLDERVSACHIPDNVLQTMSTEALLETLLRYPLLPDFYAFDTMQNGFNRIKQEQKGFAELYSRNDLFDVALQRYDRMGLHCNNTYPPFLGNGTSVASIGFTCLEFILFQDEFMNTLTEEQELIFFKTIFHKLEQKNKQTEEYKDMGKWLSSAILGKVMFENNFTPFKSFCDTEPFMEFFIQRVPSYQPASVNIPKKIYSYAKEYIAANS